MGLIIRTAGQQAKNKDLAKDLQILLKQWEDLNKTAAEQKAPCLLYRDLDMIARTVRDYLTTDITTIMVDNPDVFQQLRNWLHLAAPRQIHALKLYKDKLPIFTRYQMEEQLDRIYTERVPLKSGGSIVINPTEALVSIDVNSGRCTGQKELEETALKSNLEAADEVARQLRLRDLGGLIVIDFIDMKDKKHQKEVEAALKQSLKKDKARVTVGHISKFGLLELSRQRLRPTAEASAYTHLSHLPGPRPPQNGPGPQSEPPAADQHPDRAKPAPRGPGRGPRGGEQLPPQPETARRFWPWKRSTTSGSCSPPRPA